MTSKKAFTLIELLVVIAIIAILAAILFPVFAQAKEAAKKTQTLSNIKQSGTSFVLYTADNDDAFPHGNTPNLTSATVRYYNGGTALAPAGWATTALTTFDPKEDANAWANATAGYRKNWDLLKTANPINVQITAWASGYAAPAATPIPVNFNYNGLLQFMSDSSVAQPSRLPLLWQGIGKLGQVGIARSNPRLNCTGTGVCTFNPSGYPQADATATGRGYVITGFTNNSLWGFDQSALYVRTDTSAKALRVAGGNTNGVNNEIPWASLRASDGQFNSTTTFSVWGCRLGSTTPPSYIAAFRPDNDYTDAFGNNCY